MEQNDIIEGNRLMAEFMGAKRFGDEFVYQSDNVPFDYELDTCFKSSQLKYHLTWEWLMPVAKKCIHSFHDHRADIFHALMSCEFENLYSAIVVFIKWMSEHKEEVECWQKYKKVYWNYETNKCDADKYISEIKNS